MTWEIIKGNWEKITSKTRQDWGILEHHDADVMAARRAQLAGKLQQHFGIAQEDVEEQLTAWERKISDEWFT